MKIQKQTVGCFLLLAPFFKTSFLASIGIINSFLNALSYVSLIYIGLYYIHAFFKKNNLPSIIAILILFLQIWITIWTIIYGGSLGIARTHLLSIGLIGLIIDIYSKQMARLLKCLMLHFEICVYANIFTVILFPNGLFSRTIQAYGATQEWYIGADNYFIFWLFPALIIAFIYLFTFRNKLRGQVLILTIIITQLLKGSATGLVGTVLLLLLIILPFIKKIMTPWPTVVSALVIYIVVVISNNFHFLEPIIVEILGKDMTFTNRLGIWDNAIYCIINKPITGYGFIYNWEAIKLLGDMGSHIVLTATHCHSHLLQIAFEGGFIGLALYVLINILSLKKCALFWENPIAKVGAYGIVVLIIMGITEVFNYSVVYLILILPFYMDKMIIIGQKEEQVGARLTLCKE